MMQSSSADIEPFALSWIAQYGYCPRRCGLLAIEQVWTDNEYTAAGSVIHKKAHDPSIERRGDLLIIRNLGVYSKTLGVLGYCDCVEAHRDDAGAPLPFAEGAWRLCPIEYKHGVTRDEHEYHMQLCAQAICLEEMYTITIPEGALFFAQSHRRDAVPLTPELRDQTAQTAHAIARMIQSGGIPPGEYSAKCKKCSMADDCQPRLKSRAAPYCKALRDWLTNSEGTE